MFELGPTHQSFARHDSSITRLHPSLLQRQAIPQRKKSRTEADIELSMYMGQRQSDEGGEDWVAYMIKEGAIKKTDKGGALILTARMRRRFGKDSGYRWTVRNCLRA